MKKQPKFDLTQAPAAAFRAKASTADLLGGSAPLGGVIATITPKGPRLTLEPVLDRILITSPDEGAEEQGMMGGIHLPAGSETTFHAYAKVKVLAVAPSIKSMKPGDEILVSKPQCQKSVHDGNDYWWTTEVAVIGIVR